MQDPEVTAAPATRTIRRLGLFVLLLFVIMAAIMVVMEYRAEKMNAQVRVETAAHVVATQFDWVFEASAQALGRIERAAREKGIRSDRDAIRSITEAVENLPENYQYSIYDSEGDLTHSSIPNAPSVNIADRTYFMALQEGKELAVSSSLLSRQSGERIYIIARRLDVEEGFGGVATIAIPADILEDLSRSLGFTDRSQISIVRMDGNMIAWSPAADSPTPVDPKIFDEMQLRPNGTYDVISAADGIHRVVGYRKLTGWPVVAVASLDRSVVMVEFNRIIGFLLMLVLPMLLTLFYVVYRLFKAIAQNEERQRDLREAHDRNAFLLREVHHRVKNNLQTVMSLVRLQKMDQADKQTLLGRIASMVAVHEDMYKTDRFESVDVSSYLRRLVDEIAESQGRQVEVDFAADTVRLSGDRAMQLGLLYNEILSNAFKHAWDEGDTARIRIRLSALADEMVELTVSDNGRGLEDDQEKNMGSRLIDAFTQQLGGEMSIESNGGATTIVRFPLERELEAVAEREPQSA
ncbi:sensor histidine kinase [Pseudohoeflea coraliihabitans]|uniref:histidine kinase n=1 Tax=Pseudohoeflea coraliihabitans TaxID=2860393 RepID=A0ABS6WT41_9HYPH|nr:histidine kinase dimerization/phosphoacceptor domain -containing protein [Pseudohoeflea sp. DP4N28-3]MBW3098808.1 ATP-binding protein [Pseudohoeflea sp. DP4N28-3]